MTCPRCQHENRPGAKFCEECAAPLALRCTSCGTQLPAGAKFCIECATPVSASGSAPRLASPEAYTPKHLAERILTSKAALEGERKQVTVLFADLKGSMELLADRDPEEARKILDPVLEHMMEAVHRYEGTVNQVMGDGIMALFGAPLAHEDHAVRACYAALRMQETVKRYADGVFRTYGVPVRIRVGLNSGEVVVRSIGSDLHMDYTAVGQTTHLAARMEQLADPGTIRLTANTVHLAEGFVQIRALGPTPVKGLAAPVEVYELTGASPARSRLQATAARGLTKFVGRDGEMTTLFGALEQARAGRGQVVAIVGEPGVGKSRLVWEFTHSHRTDGCLVLEAPSVSYGKATTYLPVIDLLKRYAGIEPRDDGRKIREKVTGKLFSLDRALEPCLAPLLWLLDAPVDDPAWERLDPALRRQRLHEAIRRLLLREAREQPLVLVFEDLHWIDGETQAVLDGLVESLPTARLCLLVNYRPEYRHGWGGKTFYTQVRLDALGAAGAAELLAAVLGADPSVQPLVPLLIARTEGNPFFLEETVQTLAEAGTLAGERGAYRLVRRPEALDIPVTAQAILSARIDRLAPEDKRLLQTAAVIGKDVPYPLLAAIAELDEAALRAGLARLQEAEFLYEVQLFPELEHTFKHALTHEVAYGTLLGERKRTLHARLVDVIKQIYAGRLDEQVERLAAHASLGGRTEDAVAYLRQASLKARFRFAYREGARLLEQAIEHAERLPAGASRDRLLRDLLAEVAGAVGTLGENDRAIDVSERALALAEVAGDLAATALASGRLGFHLYIGGRARAALPYIERARALIASSGPGHIHSRFGHFLGEAHTSLGAFDAARAAFEDAIGPYASGVLPEASVWSGEYNSVHPRAFLVWCLVLQGRFDEAAHVHEGLRRVLATFAGDPYLTLTGYWSEASLAIWRGEFERADRVLAAALPLSRESQVGLWQQPMTAAAGHVATPLGRSEEDIRLLEEARMISAQNHVLDALVLAWLAEAYAAAGRLADARAATEQAIAHASERGERPFEATARLALADLDAREGCDDALARYREALALADELGMRPLGAHCHAGLAKVHRRTGPQNEAQAHLTTATAMYRKMGTRSWLERLEREWESLDGRLAAP